MIAKLIDKFISKTDPATLAGLIKRLPASFFNLKSRSSFRNIVRYAYNNSPFYKRKFDELGIDPNSIRTPEDLGDFYTSSQDIANNAEEFLAKKPTIVFESSGTTGRNKRVYFNLDELNDIGKLNAAGLFLGGVTKEDRAVNAFDFSMWIPGMITQRGIESAGLFGMVAGKVDPMDVYRRIPTYNFNIILGEPTWLIKLTEIAEKNGSYPLKLIVGGGEEMPDAARPWMKKVWQGPEIRMVYASVESGGIIAFEALPECRDYHINEYSFLVEIIDPDEEGYGEVVFTTLNRFTMPLVRYKNRDVSKIIHDKCLCGLPFRRLAKIRGRTDEMVVASGGNLYPLMFENILKSVETLTTDWQIILKLHGVKEIMEFNLELKSPETKDAVKERVFSNIKNLYPDLWKNLSLNTFDTGFVYHSPGTLRVNRKMIRLVDKRYAK